MASEQTNIVPLRFATDKLEKATQAWSQGVEQTVRLSDLNRLHMEHLNSVRQDRAERIKSRLNEIYRELHRQPQSPQTVADYLVDATQRMVLFADIIRQRGDQFLEHEAAGEPPVLAFKYEMVVDGRDLDRPCNYALVKVLSEEGDEPDPRRRPYIIIDPRAGHGAGIGGSKFDSQVGVAMRGGHPVYFVIFYPDPVPGQTLSDVCNAEGHFVRHVRTLHQDAPRPVVVGNCQGGWGAMLLAATHPDITGPVVLNGSPMSYWSGVVGENPMRYLGGLVGGVAPVMLMSDLGNGKFDGANLVFNMETLSPGNVWWAKYFNVYKNADTETERFLGFEKWWGGFYFMNEAEIRWLVENLFVGNKLARGTAFLDPHTRVDLKQINSPIIVFASWGDNITPPAQALNWILDTYQSEHEIRVEGQRIIYLVHETIGHLGIFVSSKIAKTEHTNIVSVMKEIEALAPGLYEMVVTHVEGEGVDKVFHLALEGRKLRDVADAMGDRSEESAFGAVKRLSEVNAELYETFMRPWVQAMATPQYAQFKKKTHPMRTQRWAFSSKNPFLFGLPAMAESVRQSRKKAPAENPFLALEAIYGDWVESFWDNWRDRRTAAIEQMFFSVYSSPAMQAYGAREFQYWSHKLHRDILQVPTVQAALGQMTEGEFADGVIRMLILLAYSRGAVRRSRLARANEMLSTHNPFDKLSREQRRRIINEQTIIVDFAAEQALETLPYLLRSDEERKEAIEIVEEIAGSIDEMAPATVTMLNQMRTMFGLGPHPAPAGPIGTTSQKAAE